MKEDHYKLMVEELLDLGNLTKWEMGFVESLSEKLDKGLRLSEREQEKLEEIHKARV